MGEFWSWGARKRWLWTRANEIYGKKGTDMSKGIYSGAGPATSGALRTAEYVVHHTLPIANVTACGAEVPVGMRGKGSTTVGEVRSWTDGKMAVSYDLSAVTCAECRSALTEQIPDADRQAQMVDAGWLRVQGEDFKSLRALVEAVNDSEKRLVGDDEHFKPGGKNTRAHYVKTISMDLEKAHDDEYRRTINSVKDKVSAYPKSLTTPAGGLCHDDAHALIARVRIGVAMLRGGQAWPDDARRVAADLESTVDRMLGVNRVGTSEESPMCSSGCCALLPVGAVGSLCVHGMKGADVHRSR